MSEREAMEQTEKWIAGKAEFEAAADWWAGKLATNENDAGDAHVNAVMAVLAVQPRVNDEQRAAFRQALIQELAKHTERNDPNIIFLACDYHPDGILAAALHAANIPDHIGNLPIKTSMDIKPGLVEVSHGYAAPYETIFGSKPVPADTEVSAQPTQTDAK